MMIILGNLKLSESPLQAPSCCCSPWCVQWPGQGGGGADPGSGYKTGSHAAGELSHWHCSTHPAATSNHVEVQSKTENNKKKTIVHNTYHLVLYSLWLTISKFWFVFSFKGFLLLLFSSTLLLFQPTHSAPIPNPEPLSPGLIIGAKAGALLVLKGKSWDSRASRSILKLCYSNPLVPVSLWWKSWAWIRLWSAFLWLWTSLIQSSSSHHLWSPFIWSPLKLLWSSLRLIWCSLKLIWCSLKLIWCSLKLIWCSLKLIWCSLLWACAIIQTNFKSRINEHSKWTKFLRYS